MFNDPTLHLKDEEKAAALTKVNAQIMTDLFVVAKRDIHPGEEIFVSYNWERPSTDEEQETNSEDIEDNRKPPPI